MTRETVGRRNTDASDPPPAPLRFRRVLLKLSGEALAGPSGFGIDTAAVTRVADRVDELAALGVEVAVVLGGGNIWRGAAATGLDRPTADHMGMLATVMNALALQSALERSERSVRVHTAIEMAAVAEVYIRRRAIHQLEKGHIVVLGAGTGNPFFTTDTAAALRAMELDCDVLIKATKVDGVYSADPLESPDSIRFAHLSYRQALDLGLRVMDLTAFTLCQENGMPIVVLNLWAEDGITDVVRGRSVGTLVDGRDDPEVAEWASTMRTDDGAARAAPTTTRDPADVSPPPDGTALTQGGS